MFVLKLQYPSDLVYLCLLGSASCDCPGHVTLEVLPATMSNAPDNTEGSQA